jgi:lipopolysaccharide biosynthesis protein
MTRNLCLFAHFNADDRIETYVLRYVEAIRSCGFDVVFISTSAISGREGVKLRGICQDVICRPNAGLDFASWAVGYARHGCHVEGEILLANDSVYGPIGSLGAALDRLRAMPGHVRGMVESLEPQQHIQSWFVLLSPEAHRSTTFRETLMQDFAGLSKSEIIATGEIGLSARLRKAGFTCAALFSMVHRAHDRAIVRYNPTHIIWKELIETFGVPFVKVQLLRDNPLSISNLHQWRAVLGTRSPDLIPMIEAHQSKSNRNWAGRINAAPRKPYSGLKLIIRQYFVRRHLRLDQSGRRFARIFWRYIYEFIWLFMVFFRKICLMISTRKIKRG